MGTPDASLAENASVPEWFVRLPQGSIFTMNELPYMKMNDQTFVPVRFEGESVIDYGASIDASLLSQGTAKELTTEITSHVRNTNQLPTVSSPFPAWLKKLFLQSS